MQSPEARPGAVTTPHGAPRGARVPLKRGARHNKDLVRRSALHSPRFQRGPREGMEDGVPRAAKNRGGGALLLAAPKRSEGGLFEFYR